MKKSLTRFERRLEIQNIVNERSSVTVVNLAKKLDVTEATIRNDLIALDQEQKLVRVHGGAVSLSHYQENTQHSPREQEEIPNLEAKRTIAQWAASMVENGDAILLDASTTVLQMANFLRSRQRLTVVTNGIRVGQHMAQEHSNNVLILGGLIDPDRGYVVGSLAEENLKNIYIGTAFISCAGLSADTGLTERDIQDAKIKSQMVENAQTVVLLVDSTKFEKVGLIPFASIEDVDHIMTNGDVPADILEHLKGHNTSVTVCHQSTVSTITPSSTTSGRFRIGFANLTEEKAFARDVRRGLELAAEQNDSVELIIADNQLSGQIALQVADDLIQQEVDLVIEFQIDSSVSSLIMNKFNQANIPVISVDIPMIGATFLSVDNYQAGYVAGVELGQAVQEAWEGMFDYLVILEYAQSPEVPAARTQGQIDGFQSVLGEVPEDSMKFVECGNRYEISRQKMREFLSRILEGSQLAVACFNDDAAIGAIHAAQELGSEHPLLVVGLGGDHWLRDELRQGNPALVGSTAFHPERYGEKLIEIALKILHGNPVPPAVYLEHHFINAANVHKWYPENVSRA